MADNAGNNTWFTKKNLIGIVMWACLAASLAIVVTIGMPGNDLDDGRYFAWSVAMLALAVIGFLFAVLGERRHDN